jgi:hypothetical protein
MSKLFLSMATPTLLTHEKALIMALLNMHAPKGRREKLYIRKCIFRYSVSSKCVNVLVSPFVLNATVGKSIKNTNLFSGSLQTFHLHVFTCSIP